MTRTARTSRLGQAAALLPCTAGLYLYYYARLMGNRRPGAGGAGAAAPRPGAGVATQAMILQRFASDSESESAGPGPGRPGAAGRTPGRGRPQRPPPRLPRRLPAAAAAAAPRRRDDHRHGDRNFPSPNRMLARFRRRPGGTRLGP